MKAVDFSKVRKELAKQEDAKNADLEKLRASVYKAQSQIDALPELDSISDPDLYLETLEKSERLEKLKVAMEKRVKEYIPNENNAISYLDSIVALLDNAESSASAELKTHLEAIESIAKTYMAAREEATGLIQAYQSRVREIPDGQHQVTFVGHADKGTAEYLRNGIRRNIYWQKLTGIGYVPGTYF